MGLRFPLHVMHGAPWNILDDAGLRLAVCGYDEEIFGDKPNVNGPEIAREIVRLVNLSVYPFKQPKDDA